MTRSNHAQPRKNTQSGGQLDTFLADAAKTLGLRYDWVGIAEDTFNACGLHDLSDIIDPIYRWPTRNNELPGAVVCSSLAAMLYDKVGWSHRDTDNATRTASDREVHR
jgi:malonyl CoA-acyl carrier protein transacylase